MASDLTRNRLHVFLLLIVLACDVSVLTVIIRGGVRAHLQITLIVIALGLAVIGFMRWDKKARGE